MKIPEKLHDCTGPVFKEARLCDIRPSGWLRNWLKLQADGLTGNLEVAGFPFDTDLWASREIPNRTGAPWWPYEQTAYWVDGMLRCGILLDHSELRDRGEAQCRYVLNNANPEGYLGPPSCQEPMVAGRWPHAIFFRALMAYADLGHEKQVAAALERHFLGHTHDHSGHRDVCCIEAMCWTWRHTGNPRLLAMAEETWRRYQHSASGDDVFLTAESLACACPADCHGVTFCESLKLPAILYSATGKRSYLKQASDGFKKLDTHHMLVTGVPSSTESLRGVTPLDAHETCDIADFSWACGHMLEATGKAEFADKIERACFNALPGAVTKDFRTLQYFSCPNQVVLMENSTHTLAAAGGKFMTYRPRPGTECCTAQVNRPIPNFASRQWMWRENEPAAVLYGPSSFSFTREGTAVRIEEETDYPFSESINFRICCNQPVSFTLWLRIPGWCLDAAIEINDNRCTAHLEPASFCALSRIWKPGDRIKLDLPMTLQLRRWPDSGISIEQGPLVFALPVADRRRRDPNDPYQSAEFPAWGMEPVSPWNYGLDIEEATLSKRIEVVRLDAVGPYPWSEPPIRLRLPAHRIDGWKLRQTTTLDSLGAELVDPARNLWRSFPEVLNGEFLLTPPLPENSLREAARQNEPETIELIPIGCTCLRLTIFPDLRDFR